MSSPARTKNSVAIFRNHMLPFNKLLRFKYCIAQLLVTCCNCQHIYTLLRSRRYWQNMFLFTYSLFFCISFSCIQPVQCSATGSGKPLYDIWYYSNKCIVSEVPTVLFWQNRFCVIDKPFDQYTMKLTPFCSDADHIAGSYSHVYKLIKLGWLHYLRSRLHTQYDTI